MERRLAAIMAADVVGYSRLIRADEEGTIAALQALRTELVGPSIAAHNGRIVKLMGDGMLVEFASVVDAVRAAVEVQQALADRNAGLVEEERMVFRVGINLGDVVIDGDDIQGDGVNVAARLEGLAEPGGICVSAAVRDQVRHRLDLTFEDLGDRTVKNIDEPVRAYRIVLVAEKSSGAERDVPPPLPDKPSIAVLPFDNMSGDPEQEYFTDGMVEEIITALTRFQSLHVIARNSSFAYKGRAADVRQVARELGVRYLLEGSVRKAGNRVRITGQLIDAATGAHIWADRFDGDYEDIFDLQDRITAQVVGAIEPKLRVAEIKRARRRRPDSLEAYDLYLRALPYNYAANPEGNVAALALLEQAIALDPGFAPAAAQAAWCYQQRATLAWDVSEEGDIDRAIAHARAAIAADRDDANSLAWAGFVLAIVGHDLESARIATERAMELNPNDPAVQGF
ncbi:MAG: adenylate/guanylate cyclase domain-containing protein, partial [Alphaproteobacteria bacterium]|nr:adenylate/guanylate cyclase domain-containing protein [Alphaproteobacteria bacterium]